MPPLDLASMRVAVSSIQIGARRREDMGDLDALAESIRRYGLLHPVVIDDARQLVAGHRRLEACKRLGWTEIPVRTLGTLSDAEHREIELEENVRRKDLTDAEQSRMLVELAETAAEIITASEPAPTPDSMPIAGQESKRSRGGQPKAASESKVATRIGVTRQTLARAKKHVEAVETYPELEPLPQGKALAVASHLRALPENEAVAARQRLKATAIQEQMTSNQLLGIALNGSPGARESMERGALQAQFAELLKLGRRHILRVEPQDFADALDADLLASGHRFVTDGRRWLDRLEAMLKRAGSVRAVGS